MNKCDCIGKVVDGYVNLVDLIMGKVKNFSVMDFAIMKICISFIGILIGIKFSCKLKKAVPIIGFIALFSYFYLIYKLFFEKKTTD